MISERMQSAINRQINAELWSAYLYLSMAMDAEAKSLPGIANWFLAQWKEEQDHARIFQNYMNARGAKVVLKPIDDVPQEWDSPLEMFRDTLRHEREVTEMIDNLMGLAYEENDFATVSRLQWIVDEQVEEENSAAMLAIDFDRAGRDFTALKDLDNRLAARTYHPAAPLG